jgi:DNA-binding MarR family transcriptional regulator
MGPHINSETRAAMDGIRRVVQALRVSSRAAEHAVGLSGAQLFVLQRLASSPSMSINDLAEATATHQSSVSVVVSRLVERGLARRLTSGEDGRRADVSLTLRGRRLLERAPGAAQDRLIEGLKKMTGDQRRSLAALLDRLVGLMDAGEQPPEMFFEEGGAPARRQRRKP